MSKLVGVEVVSNSSGDEFSHHGIKGMHWGVRKDASSGFKLQSSAPTVEPSLHASTKKSATQVANLMQSRYGFHISEVKELGPGHPEYTSGRSGTMAFVENTPGKAGGLIYVRKEDLRKDLSNAEATGWFGKGCGTPTAFLTHESAHALLHADQKTKAGFFSSKTSGQHTKALDTALKEATRVAKEDGVSDSEVISKISGYANHAGFREEVEAEMFSQYHWGTDPPRFVKVWGETLHKELGVDPTPFRESVKHG